VVGHREVNLDPGGELHFPGQADCRFELAAPERKPFPGDLHLRWFSAILAGVQGPAGVATAADLRICQFFAPCVEQCQTGTLTEEVF